MYLIENIRTAWQAIIGNAMRSILTMLGIVIGTAAVIAVVSVVQGLQHSLTSQLSSVGSTFVTVVPDQGRAQYGEVSRPIKLTWEDGQALYKEVANIHAITPMVMQTLAIRYHEHHHSTLVRGITETWGDINNHTAEVGRFLSTIDLTHRRKVAVIGPTVARKLKLPSNPIGQEIQVGTMSLTVIGVMEAKGRSLGQDLDNQILIPFPTSLVLLGKRAGDLVHLLLQVRETEIIEETRGSIRQILRKRHHLSGEQTDDFIIYLQDDLLKMVNTTLGSVTLVVVCIVGIALLVGGIGIMNILLVSVRERTREVGLRMALGARRRDILQQFLVESLTLSLLGGVIGILLGMALGHVASLFFPEDWPDTHVPMWALAISTGFSCIVGVFFGIYPATKASQLDPIEALRAD